MEPTDPTDPLDTPDPFDGLTPADHGTDTPRLDPAPLVKNNFREEADDAKSR